MIVFINIYAYRSNIVLAFYLFILIIILTKLGRVVVKRPQNNYLDEAL